MISFRPAVFGALLGLAAVACGAPDDESVSGGTSAFTVDSGDRFVVSASPTSIVLKKNVDGVDFPFDDAALLGKALLIHPVVHRADEGVYARATAVHDGGDRWEIDAEPLTLEEMETIAEDDVVRIYVKSSSGLIQPSSLHPLGWGGVSMNGFDMGTGWSFQTPLAASPGISVSHHVAESSFAPEAIVDWSRGKGLEIGARGQLDWRSTLHISGNAAGEVFHSKEVESASYVVTVPIGIVPVPIALRAKGFVTCGVSVAGSAEITIDVDAHATLGGSFVVSPSKDTAPTDWVHEGRWAPTASGRASVTPTAKGSLDIGGTISCAFPRIELHADVAGVAGPYLALTPLGVIDNDGAHFEGHVAAGLSAGVLGLSAGVEVNLYTWKP